MTQGDLETLGKEMLRAKKSRQGVALWSKLTLGAGAALMIAAAIPAQQGGFEISQDAILHYSDSSDLTDPVTELQTKIKSGQVKLEFDAEHGYLKSILKELGVGVNSQTLVFSKTSCQATHTGPATPRAIYYNDTVQVGFAQKDEMLDLIAIDKKKGPIFFTLEQKQAAMPTFVRKDSCISCHFGPKTLNVPGLVVRSALTKPDGTAVSQPQDFISGHDNPLNLRWGGWYVSGTHAGDVHLGNAFLAGVDLKKADLKASSNLTDLSSRFDTSKYLSPYSDTVALTVLDHTVRMQNMITRANFNSLLVLNDPSKPKPEVVKKEISEASEALLMYMLCQDEGKFNGQITGVNDFRKEFEARGPRDSKGRSLHELDLNKHLFKYSCSYLVYSPAFDGLPVPTKEYLFRRLSEILSGKDQGRIYGRMPAKSKQEVFEILWDTKPEFRAWCQAHGTSEPVTVG